MEPKKLYQLHRSHSIVVPTEVDKSSLSRHQSATQDQLVSNSLPRHKRYHWLEWQWWPWQWDASSSSCWFSQLGFLEPRPPLGDLGEVVGVLVQRHVDMKYDLSHAINTNKYHQNITNTSRQKKTRTLISLSSSRPSEGGEIATKPRAMATQRFAHEASS